MRNISRFTLAVLLVVPVSVSAQTVQELQAQAQALLARVQELQLQLQQQSGTSSGPTSAACPLIGRILSAGSTGDEVTRLQQFLAQDPSIYPEGLITGYYGSLTEAAVQRWQVKYNIVSSGTPETTGFGQVGPRTAAAMSLQCGAGGGVVSATPAVGGFIRVTPISGNVPLLVTVEATVNTVNQCSNVVYTVDYGDGTVPAQILVPAGSCQQMVKTLQHTYQSGGTYQVTLSAGSHRTSAVVTVSGTSAIPTSQTSDSISANPTSGTAPLTVSFTGIINSSKSCSGGVYTLLFGDGQSAELTYPVNGCQAFSFNLTHQYTSGGTLTARLYKGTQTSSAAASTVITVVSGVSAGYSIKSVTPAVGGNPFAASVQIEYPACAAVSLDWDDNTSPVSIGAQSGCSGTLSTSTHNHTYAAGGTYTLKLKDGSGNIQSNASIIIAN